MTALPGSERAELDRSLVTGLAWTGGAKWAAQLLRWVASLVIARLLLPSDYGLVGMALIYVDLVQLVNQFGLSAAIVQNRNLDSQQVARLGGLSILIAIGLFAVSCALAFPLASFFGESAVRSVIVGLSAKLIIDSLGMVPRALLARDLRFNVLALSEAASAAVMSGVTLACAFVGLGYWSLVIGVLSGAVLTTAASIAMRPHRLALPFPLHEIRGSVRMGRDVLISSLAWYGFSNADFLIVGRVFDKATLGFYTMAWNVASVPVEKIAALVGGVTPGVFSAVQHDLAGLRRYFLSITEALAIITMPLAIGLALVGDDFVIAVVGERWSGAVLPMRILACLGGFRSLTTLLSQVMVATGNAHLSRRCSLIAVCILPICFLVGSRWGLSGVAAGWLVGFPLSVILFDYRYALGLLQLAPQSYLKALKPALISTAVMALSLVLLRLVLPTTMGHLPRLGIQVGIGALAYCGTLLLAHRDRVRVLYLALRGTRKLPVPPASMRAPGAGVGV